MTTRNRDKFFIPTKQEIEKLETSLDIMEDKGINIAVLRPSQDKDELAEFAMLESLLNRGVDININQELNTEQKR